jgi:hypothetical protein
MQYFPFYGIITSVLGPDMHGSAPDLVDWIRIQEGKNNPQKYTVRYLDTCWPKNLGPDPHETNADSKHWL